MCIRDSLEIVNGIGKSRNARRKLKRDAERQSRIGNADAAEGACGSEYGGGGAGSQGRDCQDSKGDDHVASAPKEHASWAICDSQESNTDQAQPNPKEGGCKENGEGDPKLSMEKGEKGEGEEGARPELFSMTADEFMQWIEDGVGEQKATWSIE
eukprot:4037669-Karenia_brevis.AAC.1